MLEQQRAEQARIQAEADAAKALEEERIRLKEEEIAAKEKEKRELFEHGIREEQLKTSCNQIKQLIELKLQHALEEKAQVEVKIMICMCRTC